MNTLHVKRDDTVIVISGDDKGVKGKVIAVSPTNVKLSLKALTCRQSTLNPEDRAKPAVS